MFLFGLVFSIKNFNTDQIAEILKKIRKQESINIDETKHCQKRFLERATECSRETVYNLLKTAVPDGNNKTSSNTFKIIYEHPDSNNNDIYIIIGVKDMKNIKLITVYAHSSSRRKK